MIRTVLLAACAAVSLGAAPLQAQTMAADTSGTPQERAEAMLAQMTTEEKLLLVKGYFATDFPASQFTAPPESRQGSAGYVPGIARLGIPPQWQADAGIGVASQGGAPDKRGRTALPSGLAVAASWDPDVAFDGGRMIGRQARADGFNVLLAGSVNLTREPRNGRNFEYAGEDPLLAGVITGEAIRGIQSNDIVSTAKHYALNAQETDRGRVDAILDEAAFRMSDLLAFEIALEVGNPGSVMCAYNKVNGDWACENHFLLTKVLREDWGWPGYVMSDWGAAHTTAKSANAGLDQESGYGLQRADHYGAALAEAVRTGEVSGERLDLMAGRILSAMFDHGLVDNPVTQAGAAIDFAGDEAVSRRAAEAGAVLLKNEGGILPLATSAKRIAVIGGHADKGVISGGGSSQVYPGGGPDGGNAVPGIAPTSWPGPVVFYPSSPLAELRALMPGTEFVYHDGDDPAAAAMLAASADMALVFGSQWASESIDVPLHLDGEQDALVAAVAAANNSTAVVLQTGGPVLMPWLGEVKAVLEAWYPGRMGGAAIANLLTGRVNPSGHLPVTFPASLDQLPYPGAPRSTTAVYNEGAAIGYKWFDTTGSQPLFAFGHGLSYTDFAYAHPDITNTGQGLVFSLDVTNIGDRAGADVVQVYVEGEGWEAPRRLAGFARVELQPRETRTIGILIDPRLLAVWDADNPGWSRAAGSYTFSAGHSSRVFFGSATIELPSLHLPVGWKPEDAD